MISLALLIKPVSSGCNLNCRYCFYHDISNNREIKNYGKIDLPLTDTLIKKALESDSKHIVFAFQGGEPTLIGLDYYEVFVSKVKFYNKENKFISYALQTNGTLLNDKWCGFFKENNFLIGVSLDGNIKAHNINRNDTFFDVIKNIKLLETYQVDFNILTVVNKNNHHQIKDIYQFYKKQGFKFLQFIPCLPALNNKFHQDKYALTYNEYYQFLENLLNLWLSDFKNGNYISIRYFDNLIRRLNNQTVNMCELNDKCSITLVVESNGDVYPCDFYCLDDYLLGNIKMDSLNDLLESELMKVFSNDKITSKCLTCEYKMLCYGGCKRYREQGHNYYCPSYKRFFKNNLSKLKEVNKLLKVIS